MQLSIYANETSEAGLIGAVLHEPKAFYDAMQSGVTVESFSNATNRDTWQAFVDLHREGKPLNRYHLASRMEAQGTEGVAQMRVYREACPGPSYVPSFLADIKRHEMARVIKAEAQTALAKLDRGDAPQEILSSMQASISKGANDGIRVRTLGEIRQEKVAQWKAAKGQGYVGIPSGFSEINQFMGGYRPAVMTVLGGYRGEGKSTLARQEATSIAMRGIPVGVISMEDPDTVAGSGIAGNIGDFSVYHLDVGESNTDPDDADRKWQGIEHLPMHISDSPQTIGSLVNTMTMMVARYGIKWVMIDHIQYILPDGKGRAESRNVEVMRYSGQICAALRRLDIACLTLSQLSRESEKESREPKLSDLRDSGAIEQDSRAVMLLYRDGNDKRHRLRIAKNNFGPTGKKLKLFRVDGRQRFVSEGVE